MVGETVDPLVPPMTVQRLDGKSRPGMEVLALALGNSGDCGLARQRVLEEELRLTRARRLAHQFRAFELHQDLQQLFHVDVRHRAQQIQGSLHPD